MNRAIFNNRKFQIGAAVIVIVVLLVGFMAWKNLAANSTTAVNNNVLPTEVPVPTITASDLGATLVYGPAKKTVILKVENTTGISGIDYELSYTATGDIPRGAIGTLDLKKSPVSKEITLGTCSDVCHYDTNVKDVKAVLKITKEDGSVFSSTVNLEE